MARARTLSIGHEALRFGQSYDAGRASVLVDAGKPIFARQSPRDACSPKSEWFPRSARRDESTAEAGSKMLKRCLLMGALLSAPDVAGAVPVTLDSESLSPTGVFGGFESYGETVSEDGFDLLTDAAFGGFAAWLPGTANDTGSNSLFPNQSIASVVLTHGGGSAFSVSAIDLAFSNLAQPGSSGLTFTGTRADASTIDQTFLIDATRSTFLFAPGFSNLVSLSWSHHADDANSHQFDDLIVEVVPEPTSALLLSLGLAGLARRNGRASIA